MVVLNVFHFGIYYTAFLLSGLLLSSITMAATTTATDAADKIAALKAAVQEKKVLPKRSTRGQNGSTVADESLISNASSQDYETTECYFLWGCELTR